MNFAAFLLLLGILGIVVGILNKGFRVISFFIALLALVLMVGMPGSRGNFFANLFNPTSPSSTGTATYNTETGQTQTAAPDQTNGGISSQPNGTAIGSSTTPGTGTTGTTGTNTGTTGTTGTGTGTQSAPYTTTPTSTVGRRPRALW